MDLTIKPLTDPDPIPGHVARRMLVLLLGVSLILKLILAANLPLVVDEAYAIAVAREYSLSFFDHPPLGFWLPVLMGDLTGVAHPLVYRAPFLLSGLGTALVMFALGRELGGNRAGIWTTVLYVAAPFFLLSGGMFVVPDGPLGLFTALAAWQLVRILKGGGDVGITAWILVGLALALALASKYQAAWFPVAALIHMAVFPRARRWLLTTGPWVAAMIGLMGLAPAVVWNMNHDWASFAFHGGRAGGGINPGNFAQTMVAQTLFLLPTGLLAVLAAILALGRGRNGSDAKWFLLLLGAGPILIFNYVYLTGDAPFAHWTMPGWLLLLPLAGERMATLPPARSRRFLRWTGGLVAVVWAVFLALMVQANTGALTRWFYNDPPHWDQTLALPDLGGLRGELVARGLWSGTEVLMAKNWLEGGLFDAALAGQKPMRIQNERAAHHFRYLSDSEATGATLLMAMSRKGAVERTGADLLARARAIDAGATLLAPIMLLRGRQTYIAISLVRLRLD